MAHQPWALKHGKVQHQCLRVCELMGSLCCAVLHIAAVILLLAPILSVCLLQMIFEELDRCELHWVI